MAIQFQNEITKLREMIPVGIVEAKELLVLHNGNIPNAKDSFVTNRTLKINTETGFDISQVKELFLKANFDVPVTLERIRIIKYDQSFDTSRLLEIEKIDFKAIDYWIYWNGYHSLESGILLKGTLHLYRFFKKHLLLNNVTAIFEELINLIEKHNSSDNNWEIPEPLQREIYNSKELKKFSRTYQDNIIAIKEEIQNFSRNFMKLKPEIASDKLNGCQYL